MEDKLKELVEANAEGKREKWALEWKRQGGRVVGVLCSYVPREILTAAGLLPWRITGTASENIGDALAYRPSNSCGYCNGVLQSLLTGQLSFLDGVVATTAEQDLVRLWDVWVHLKTTPFAHILHLPHDAGPSAIGYYANRVKEFSQAVEGLAGKKITQEGLHEAIQLHNRVRSLVSQVYQLRKKDRPPLSGTEVLGITLAGTVMPPQEFCLRLEALLPYLETRQAPVSRHRPRVLVSSDHLDNPAYMAAVERAGCLAAMDDLDTGSRFYWGEVKPLDSDPLGALARRYLLHPGSPRMFAWPEQVAQVVAWVKEFRIQGVVELVQRYGRSREMRRPYFVSGLERAGVPVISLEREYYLANLGQLQTRMQAFIEILEAR